MMPQKVFFNSCRNERLFYPNTFFQLIQKTQSACVTFVTGNTSFRFSGLSDQVKYTERVRRVVHLNGCTPNPTLTDVERNIGIFKKQKSDLVIAIGGGSVIDFAKNVILYAVQPESPRAYILEKKPLAHGANIPLVAIPTTAGAGSEATPYAALYHDGRKYATGHPSILPQYVILDPELTYSMLPHLTAVTGLCALGQSIESYYSIFSTDECKAYAAEAIKLVIQHILAATCNEPNARSRMLYAAYLSGKALTIPRTGPCPALAHPMMLRYGIPYGHAMMLTMGPMLAFNALVTDENCVDPRGMFYVRRTMREVAQLMGIKNPHQVQKFLEILMQTLGLATHLRDFGIRNEKDIDHILETGYDFERMKKNPRKLTREIMGEMLLSVI